MADKSNSTLQWRCFVVTSVLVQIITVSICIYLLASNGKLGKSFLSLGKSANEEDKAVQELGKEYLAEEGKIRRHAIIDRMECGGVRYVDCITGEQQLIISPNSHPPSVSSLQCKWDIYMIFSEDKPDDENYYIFMEFQDALDIHYSPNCTTSVLEVREDSQQGPILSSYCGKNISAADISYNGSLHVLYKTDNLNFGGFVAAIYCDKTAAEPGLPITGNDSTYTIWGTFACPTYGPPIYSGFALGYKGSQTVELACAEPSIPSHSSNVGNSPIMTLAQYNYGSGAPVGFPAVNRQVIECAICLVQRAAVFTLINTDTCSGKDYDSIYSGHLMAVTSSFGEGPSAAICVVLKPTPSLLAPGGSGRPQVDFVKSPSGQVVKCVLCKTV